MKDLFCILILLTWSHSCIQAEKWSWSGATERKSRLLDLSDETIALDSEKSGQKDEHVINQRSLNYDDDEYIDLGEIEERQNFSLEKKSTGETEQKSTQGRTFGFFKGLKNIACKLGFKCDQQGYPPKPEVHHHEHVHVHKESTATINTGYPPREGKMLYNYECTCVLPHQCPLNKVVRRNGRKDQFSHLIDPRDQGVDILANDNFVVGARNKRGILQAGRQSKTIGKTIRGHFPGSTGCGSQYVCCRIDYVPEPIKPQLPTCGKSFKSSLLGRIANSDYDKGLTQFGQYPWQAAILRPEGHDASVFVCGGTLVSSNHVLTAAHCIVQEELYRLKVRLGDWDVSREKEFYKHVDFPIKNTIVHPEFYSGNLQNDLAVITIQGYVDFKNSPHISPVCLPNRYADFTNQKCYSTGWGKDAFNYYSKHQEILKEVDVPIVDRRSCEYALQKAGMGRSFRLADGFMCAGGEKGKDTCKGDGGGPLVCPTGHNTYQLAGIVSWGIDCGIQGVPGVYVDVPYYVDWIKSIIGYTY